MFEFRVEAEDGAARTGTLTLPHGTVQTPMFMPVADPEAWASCVAGAEDKQVYLGRLEKAGFVNIETTDENVRFDDEGVPLNVASVKVVAHKPG